MHGERVCGVADGGKLPILGSEVVAPIADAVGLVDSERCEAEAPEAVDEGGLGETLRGDVEQLQLILIQRLLHCLDLVRCHGARHVSRSHTFFAEAVDLILHQADQWTDNHCEPAAHQCRCLVADALAPSSRQDDQRIAPLERRPHRPHLLRTHVFKSPMACDGLPQLGLHFAPRGILC